MMCCHCRHYHAIETPSQLPLDERGGQCRIKPPQVARSSCDGGSRTLGVFPLVQAKSWCGEYAPRVALCRDEVANGNCCSASNTNAAGAATGPLSES